jgi:hypothetical protein
LFQNYKKYSNSDDVLPVLDPVSKDHNFRYATLGWLRFMPSMPSRSSCFWLGGIPSSLHIVREVNMPLDS